MTTTTLKRSAATVTQQWINLEQVQVIYGLSAKYMQNLRREGRVRYRSLNGRKFRYLVEDIERLFQ